MKDYIDILLEHIQKLNPCFDEDYVSQKYEEEQATKAFLDSLDAGQRKLYLAYEAERMKTENRHDAILLRQAFLLARQIYR